MDIYNFKKKLERYLKGSANETESALIEAWYKSYEVDEVRQIHDGDKASVKNSIKQKIHASLINEAKIKRINFYRVAASLLFIAGISILFYRNRQINTAEAYITIQTKPGEMRQLVLPDSSVIWVNALTRVRIPEKFNNQVRNVFLDEGEAFFDVKHNALKPFKVNTPTLQVQVLGTSFNINAYKALNRTTVGVATGRVGVSAGNKTLSFLTPGKQLVFNNQTKAFANSSIDTKNLKNWQSNNIRLKQASFNELALIIKNLYGIELSAATPAVAKYQFTLRLERGTPLNDALKIISTIHNTHFRKEGNKVVLY